MSWRHVRNDIHMSLYMLALLILVSQAFTTCRLINLQNSVDDLSRTQLRGEEQP